jgi:hypothetical protein
MKWLFAVAATSRAARRIAFAELDRRRFVGTAVFRGSFAKGSTSSLNRGADGGPVYNSLVNE